MKKKAALHSRLKKKSSLLGRRQCLIEALERRDLLAAVGPVGALAPCNVYMTANQQTMDGFGFSSGWQGTMPAARNNSAYGTLGFSLLRIQIDPADWTAEINNANAAHAAGAKVLGSCWTAPGSWTTTGGAFSGHLLPSRYADYANYLANAVVAHNLDWVSPSNEPDLGWMAWTSDELRTWIGQYGGSLGAPLVGPESCWFSDTYGDPILDDSAAGPNISVYGGHLYGASPSVHQDALDKGKPVWVTEKSFGDSATDITAGGIDFAQEVSDCVNDQMSAYIYWNGLVNDDGSITKNGYVMGQFAKWIRPDSSHVSADYSPQAGVSVTAYNVNGSVVIVAVNANTNLVSQQFALHNGSGAPLEGYRTSGTEGMADIGGFALSGGSFAANLPAQSITTFVQTNGVPLSVPSPWASQDIGSVGIAGSTTYTGTAGTNGAFTVSATGNNIGNTADAFRFVYKTNSGDSTIVARVSSEQGAGTMAKAGVMVRDSLNPNAANAFIGVTPGNGVVWQYRSSDGGGTISNTATGVSAPCWVKLTQSGSVFTGYYSADGTTWTQLGTARMSMDSAPYGGLAFCNNGDASLGTATFDNVSAPDWPVPAPAAPTGLTAKGGAEQVTLTWQASSDATNYIIQRAATSGGPYTTLANCRGTIYIDANLIGGTTYYYVVSATNDVGQSTASAQASATPTPNVPSPWLAQDIGSLGLYGSEGFTNGVFSVNAAGSDVFGAADAFRFVHVPVTNDCTIVARVVSVQNVDAWSKAGVMIRASTDANAANVFIGVTPGHGITWQYRSSTGGGSTSSNATGLTAPYWVKLVRSGNTFTGSYSSDGRNWTQLGSTTFAMASATQAGLAVTSHNNTALCTATFDHVIAPGWAPPYASTPTGLVATAGFEQVALSWTASSNATNYNLKRATSSGGPYTTVANVTSTSYTDTHLDSGTTYYYVVSAVNSLSGESGNSAQTSATPTITVPAPWSTRDIGAPGQWGSASFSNGAFTIAGSGGDIWDTADAFRFVYEKPGSSNFTITTRVATVQNTDGWSKAGVMVRESLDANAANVFIAVTPGNGVSFQYRSSTGGGCTNIMASGSAPYWVRLVRSGDTFSGYCSSNGTNWTLVGTATVTMASIPYIGMGVTSHNDSSLCTATFDNVTVPGWSTAPLAASATVVSSSQVSVTWNAMTNATSYRVKRSTTSGGSYTTIATGVIGTSYTDNSAPVSTRCYYVVSAIVGGSETANGLEAALNFPKLTGAIIGTAGSWANSGNTIDRVFDNDLTTYFDGPTGNGCWAGLDFGAGANSRIITKVNYAPRPGSEPRMVGGLFQGANQADFSDAVTLYTVGTQPTAGVSTSVSITNTTAFRYVRYLSPDNGYGNVAEVEFYGYRSTSTASPTVATAASATPSPVTGTTTNLSVLGADDNGEANLTYTWATTGTPPAAVAFSANGANAAKNTTATFTKAGTYNFLVTITDQSGLTTSSSVGVTVNQTLTSVAVTPGTSTVATGAQQQFVAVAKDQFGNAMSAPPTVTWSLLNNGGGSISASGLYSAPSFSDTATVQAFAGSVGGAAYVGVGSGRGQLRLVTDDWGKSGLTSVVTMFEYVPVNLQPNPPIVVVNHYWGGTASGMCGMTAGLVAAADRYGFIIIFPQASNADGTGRGWDNGSTTTLTRYGGGDSNAVANMVTYAENKYSADTNRIYAIGMSSGGMITQTLLGVYPDVFKAGIAYAGVPVGADGWGGDQMSYTPQQWGDIVRNIYPGYSGPRPRVQLWHGTADDVVSYNNLIEGEREWSNVLGLSADPTLSTTGTLCDYPNQFTHHIWQDANGNIALETWSEANGGHGGNGWWNPAFVIPYFNLDKVAATGVFSSAQGVDIGSPSQAGSGSYDANTDTYTLAGGGAGVLGTSDQFHFLSKGFTGDGTILARVTGVENTSSSAEAGVMLRDSTNANAMYAAVVVTAGNGLSFQWRSSTGGTAGFAQVSGITAPAWVKLVRSGNGFTAFYATTLQTPAASDWIQLGTAQTIAMSSAAQAGLAATSSNNGILSTSRFSGLELQCSGIFNNNLDIGSPSPTGSGGYDAGSETYTLAAGGADVWDTSDQFHYLSRSLSGDGWILARVTGVQNTNGWAKAGVMFRDSTDANAMFANMVVTPSSGVSFQWRSSTGGNCGYAQVGGISAPAWVKLVRSGNSFTAYYATTTGTPAASDWIQVGSAQTIAMGSTAQLGLAVTSHNNGTLCTSTFTGVQVSNHAPTVATAASASPNPVTGKSTNLSVLGADDGGEANLSYTWSVTSKPSGAANPSFSINGSNAAKSNTATFSLAGSYTFLVTIADADGASVTSSVSVTVNQTFTSITVSPATVITGQTHQFAATALDQFAAALATQPSFTWSVTSGGGSINSSGLYTAPATAGSSTVQASSGAVSGSATVTIVTPEWVWYQADASSGTTLADSSGHNNTASLSGSYSFGSGVSGNALNLSGGYASLPTGIVSSLNDFTIGAWVKLTSLDTWSRIFDFGTGSSVNMFLTPQAGGTNLPRFAITTGGGGAEQQVDSNTAIAVGVWTHVAVTLSGDSCTLYLNGVAVGNNSNMTVHPTALGNTTQNYLGKSQYPDPALHGSIDDFRLYGRVLSASEVLAMSTPTVATAAAASPSPVTGATTALSVLGADVTGGEAGLRYTWSCTSKPTGAAAPSFSVNGTNAAKNSTATFSQAGSYSFTVTITDAGGLSTASSVSVSVNQTLTSIAVTPDGASVSQGATRQFTATGYDQFGAALTSQPSFTWSSTSGSFSTSTPGLWTAGTTTGTYSVTAASGGISGSASVTVVDTTAAVLVSAGSVKTHGTAGSFEIPLNLSGNAAVECRANGPTQLSVRFNESVTLGGSFSLGLSSGTGQATASGSTITISMSGAANGRLLCVTLSNVSDLAGNLGTYKVYVAVLLGDVNGSGSVTSQDMTVVTNNNGKLANASNFRADLNCSGAVTSQDMTVVTNNNSKVVDRVIPASTSSSLLTLVSDKSKTNSLLA